MKRVVITGMGTVNPLGCTIDTFWENVKKGTLGISKIDMFDTTEVEVSVAGIIRDFHPEDYFEKKKLRHMERFTQFAVASAVQAMDDCGSDFKDLDPYRLGTIIGCGIGGLPMTEKQHALYLEKGPNWISPFFVPVMISNMAAGEVAMRTGFKGDNFCTTTACASATHAIGEAFRKVKDGYLDVCICGGSEATIDEFTLGGFKTMKALTKEPDPTKASIPFDKNRSGFVLGEGCGILVLEEYGHAKARGAKIYAEIAGYGATCDAYHMTAPSPECEASARGMVAAYQEAGLQPENITYINAHGTATGLNDKYETTAIKIALGEEQAHKVKINSTKSMTGHMLGGTGAVEAIVSALSIRDGFIHQTIGYTTPDPECDLDYCVDGPVEMPVKAALSNSLGFGGHNATLCFKACEAERSKSE
ncbi:MAG: beta-ketoacyl-ACP synthase II [Ruminococcus sp.]|nr:beta-ketoacyl-ACP synthase II [Ruminococcus sp.]